MVSSTLQKKTARRTLVDLRLAIAFLASYEKAVPVRDLRRGLAACSSPAARPVDLASAFFLLELLRLDKTQSRQDL